MQVTCLKPPEMSVGVGRMLMASLPDPNPEDACDNLKGLGELVSEHSLLPDRTVGVFDVPRFSSRDGNLVLGSSNIYHHVTYSVLKRVVSDFRPPSVGLVILDAHLDNDMDRRAELGRVNMYSYLKFATKLLGMKTVYNFGAGEEFQGEWVQDGVKIISTGGFPNSKYLKHVRFLHDFVYLSVDLDVLSDKSGEEHTVWQQMPLPGGKKFLFPVSSEPFLTTPPKEVVRAVSKLRPDMVDVYTDSDLAHQYYKIGHVQGLVDALAKDPTRQSLDVLKDYIPLLLPQKHYVEWVYQAFKDPSFTIQTSFSDVFKKPLSDELEGLEQEVIKRS